MHLLILFFAVVLASVVYAWGSRAPKEKWELLRRISHGKLGIYKRRKYIKLGKFERVLTTYAILRNATPGKVWSFVWRIDRIRKGGRAVGLRSTIDTSGQTNLHEIGFSPPLGLYVVYTGEEDNLSYPEREHYLLNLYKKTAAEHKWWRADPAFLILQLLSRWRLSMLSFIVAAWTGTALVSSNVEAPQLVVWTLLVMLGLGFIAGVACVVRARNSVMRLQASGEAILVGCLLGLAAAYPAFLGINALQFSTICEGSVPVERFWTETSRRTEVYYASVILPSTCQFDAQRTQIGPALYNEFQTGRRIVDVVVSEGLLGYKRIKLIGS